MEAIGLNPIRLDAIGIDPIRLNAIRLGVPGASSGSDRPYIAPEVLASLVAVVKCDGKSNNDPDRAIIKNLVDPDNPFVISNAAYKLNSGFGKYEVSFKERYVYNNSVVKDVTDESFNFDAKSLIALLYKTIKVGESNDEPSYKIKISNLKGELKYTYINDAGKRVYVKFTSDGEYTLPISYDSLTIENTWIGFSSNSASSGTITQIPSFQGALVTDGVDDLIVSQKSAQEMLGGSNEITVVSMINTIVPNTEQLSYTNAFPINGVNVAPLRNKVSNTGKTGIYGYTYKNNAVSVVNNILGDKNDYEAAIAGEPQVDDRFEVTRLKFNSSVAWYWTFIANRVLTSDEINQIIAYYNLDKYVKPDIYYDVKKQGLSNNTPDDDWYLKDFSGNGRDMQLYNYGKTPESGINEEGGLQSDGVTDYGQFVGDLGLKDYTVAVDRAYPSLKGNGVPVISNIKSDTATPFLFEFADNTSVVRPYSFGATTVLSPMELSRKISYQSTYIYDGTAINKGLHGNTGDGLTIGRFGIDTQYANIALWSLLLFPYTLSEFLLERQLKRYKLGSIYPSNSIVFRPYITSNLPYNVIEIRINNELVYYWINQKINNDESGKYFPKGSTMNIRVKHDNTLKIPSKIKYNGKEYETSYYANGVYQVDVTLDKTPQKIEIQIDEYIHYEDIVQPYPFIIPIIDTDGKEYTYGDKIKVGTEIRGGINGNNLLPELYKLNGYFNFNGAYFSASNKHVIGKTNVFELTNAPTYLKANEPNCIADPQRLRIPNSSYKILGYIPDISGHGNHLKINNSAYAGMSGANGYMADFTNWQHTGVEGKATDSKFEAIGIASTRWILYKGTGYNFPTTTYIVTGIPKDVSLTYNNDTTALQIENGVPFTIASYSASSSTGFVLSKGVGADLTGLIIEQIGEYEGSFCLDGVEDYLTIPTLSHGAKQVLMKVNYRLQNNSCTLYDQRIKESGWQETFAIVSNNHSVAYSTANSGQTYIDGILNTNIIGSTLANITHNLIITNKNVTESNTGVINIGAQAEYKAFGNMSLFAFMFFDDISSEDEIKELNDIVGIEGNTDDLFNENN